MAETPIESTGRRETWIRLLFVILFAVIYSIAELLVAALVAVQFGFVLIAGERNRKLLEFGDDLSRFIYQILQFVTFNSDDKPFPFTDWPSGSGAAPRDT